MKTMQSIAYVIGATLMALLALPKAIGLTLVHYLEAMPLSQFGEGPPSDLKALHEATEKAFKSMQENIAKVQETATAALETSKKEGTITSEQNTKLKELGETGKAISDQLNELKARTLEVEQKLAKKPGGGGGDEQPKSMGQIVAESDEFKAAMGQGNKARNMAPVNVGSFHKNTIVNATLNNDQPLVSRVRLPSIITPGLRRMTVRDLLPQTPISSNVVEFAKELLFTNNAGPQGGGTSPTVAGGEGEIKPESSLTFELANAIVITFAHWIAASRQVLSDAPLLQGYIDGRLRYGLMLAEEGALLNGDGTAGTINGLMNQATAFTYGSTNQTALDTLLKAQLQVSLSEYEVTGYVLHPIDWTNILLLKDTTGRYLFSDPHGMEAPRVWGKDVVPTQAMTAGQFLAGAFMLGAEIFDREDTVVRIAEQHADFAVRNLVAVICEERLALAVYRSQAFVKGAISNAG